MSNDTPVNANRTERSLAFMVAAVIGLSVICFVAVIIGTAAHVDFAQGAWPVVIVLPAVGVPIGVLLLIALLVVSTLRRRRESGAGG